MVLMGWLGLGWSPPLGEGAVAAVVVDLLLHEGREETSVWPAGQSSNRRGLCWSSPTYTVSGGQESLHQSQVIDRSTLTRRPVHEGNPSPFISQSQPPIQSNPIISKPTCHSARGILAGALCAAKKPSKPDRSLTFLISRVSRFAGRTMPWFPAISHLVLLLCYPPILDLGSPIWIRHVMASL